MRFPRAVLIAIVAVAVASVGACRTFDAGTHGIDDPTGGSYSGLPPADHAFLRRVEERALPAEVDRAQITVFFSFDRWDEGRSVAATLFPEFSSAVDRINRGVVFLYGPHRVAIVETSVSRLTASIALNAEGWQREGWGVWRFPHTQTTVLLDSDRIWYILDGPAGEAGLVGDGTEPLTRLLRTATTLAPPGRSVASAGIVRFPSLEGVPPEFQPLTMAFTVSGGSEVDARFLFRDPRSARVALVPFRLRGERTLGAYGFSPTDEFDIQRREDEIIVSGVVVETLTFPVGDESPGSRGE